MDVGQADREGRVVRVLPDEPGLNRTFDFLLPDRLDGAADIRLGSIVRVNVSGRNIRGWVTGLDVAPPDGVVLKNVAKVSGFGPPRELLALSKWAAERWWGRPANLLRTASPLANVRRLPSSRTVDIALLPDRDLADGAALVATEAVRRGGCVQVRVPPCADTFSAVVEAVRAGGSRGTLVLVPSIGEAVTVVRRIRRFGVATALLPDDWANAAAGGCVVVGTRSAAWAPITQLGAVVVIDAHAEVYQQEQMPTWNAREVAIERARRLGVPCLLVSPTGTISAGEEPVVRPSRSFERSHWPLLDVVDRSLEEPGRQGLLSSAVASVLRKHRKVLFVLNTKGRAAALVCHGCHTVARCEHCDGGTAQVPGSETELICRRCSRTRPLLCISCGRSSFRSVRMGVTRAREELEALAGRPVAEITADRTSKHQPHDGEARPDLRFADRTERDERRSRGDRRDGQLGHAGDHDVWIGTEAALHRVQSADAVVFLDFDAELLAPRFRANEQAFALLAKAAALVGSNGRLVVQTRLPQHDVIQAAVLGDPERFLIPERSRREHLRLPPFAVLAHVSQPGAASLVDQLDRGVVEVLGPTGGPFLVRAADSSTMGAALRSVERPNQRVRVEVDPQRV